MTISGQAGTPSLYAQYEWGRDLDCYEADPNLRFVLEGHLEPKTLQWSEQVLHDPGERCGSDIVRRADETDRLGHRLVRYDRYGRDVSQSDYAPSWLANLDEVLDFGLVGWNHDPERPLVRLVANLDGLLRGEPAGPVVVERKLQQHFRLLGPQGLTGIAMAGVDMALWDARARACGVPLVTLLGGEPTPVPAYASLRTMRPKGAAAEAEEALALGFTAVKVKVGNGELAADLETIRAIRQAVGDRVKLMVDYNQSLSVAEAVDRVRALDDEGLYWIEEPTRADDYDGHARIAAAARTAIQLGRTGGGRTTWRRASRHARPTTSCSTS